MDYEQWADRAYTFLLKYAVRPLDLVSRARLEPEPPVIRELLDLIADYQESKWKEDNSRCEK